MSIVAQRPYGVAGRTALGFGVDSRLIEKKFRESLACPLLYGLAENSANEAFQRLGEIASLPEDWDGADALPISAPTVQIAKNFLSQVVYEVRFRRVGWVNPDISPTPTGGVYFNWNMPSLKLSVLVNSEADNIVLLIGNGRQRSQRHTIEQSDIVAAVVNILETQPGRASA